MTETLSWIDESALGGERLAPYLFLVLHAHDPRRPPLRIALSEIDEVHVGRGGEPSFEVSREAGVRRLTVRLPDPWLSSKHARFAKEGGGSAWTVRDLGSKNGSTLMGKRFEAAELDDGMFVELGHTFFLFREAEAAPPGPGSTVWRADEPRSGEGQILLSTLSPSFAGKLAELSHIAGTAVPVVLEGETGTGKEVVARALHRASGRRGEYVAINCGALPPTLIEAELFGAKKGAFSGANEDRPGLVRAAHGGTLLLDEVGELPLPAQVALLRVLQEREVLPIGATRPVLVDVRFVAATHRPLDRMVEAGTFRRDLMMRLAGYRLCIPPLRERLMDFGVLLGELLSRLDPGLVGSVSPRAARALLRFGWPGNVRQLERVITTACMLARGSAVGVEHLPEEVRDGELDALGARNEEDLAVRAELLRLLVEHRGNVSAVARSMGRARMQVQRWMKRFGFAPDSFK
ncbi:MAG: sigma 54-interacting transcriptional regulator [Polyangiaceae bacterium]